MLARSMIIAEKTLNKTVLDMNAEEVTILIPAMIFVSILMLIGTVGNILTLYIFSRKFGGSNHRTFVLSLAGLDLASCLLSMPFHLSMMLLPYMYYNVYACKILELVSYLVAYGSVFLITVIAVERCRITCQPFEKKMSARIAKICCGCCIAVAFVLSVPASVLYGHSTVEMGNGVNGVQCFIDDEYIDTVFPIIFNSMPVLITTVCIILLSVLYTFVIKTLFRSLRFRRSMRESPSSNKTYAQVGTSKQTTDPDESYPLAPVNQTACLCSKILHNPKDLNPSSVSSDPSSTSTTGSSQTKYSKYRSRLSTFFKGKTILVANGADEWKDDMKCDLKSNNLITVIVEQKKGITKKPGKLETDAGAVLDITKRRELRTRRTTVILLTITVVFVLSFLPHIGLMITAAANSNFLPSLTKTELSVFHFFQRTFFINNVANPIIYGFCDNKFQKQFRKIFQFSRKSE